MVCGDLRETLSSLLVQQDAKSSTQGTYPNTSSLSEPQALTGVMPPANSTSATPSATGVAQSGALPSANSTSAAPSATGVPQAGVSEQTPTQPAGGLPPHIMNWIQSFISGGGVHK